MHASRAAIKPITSLVLTRVTPLPVEHDANHRIYELSARRTGRLQHITYVVIKEPFNPARELSTVWDYARAAILKYEQCARVQAGELELL